MDLKQFQEESTPTESVVENVNVNLSYLAAVLQINIATGNLLDQIKKNVYYGKEFDNAARAALVTKIIEAMDTKALFMEDPSADTEILSANSRLFHAIVGIATESTELLENLINPAGIDIINMLEEITDINWYQAIAIDAAGADWEQMLDTLIAKLKKRYPEKFKVSDALTRDLDAERKILDTMDHDDKEITIKDLS